MRVKSCEASDGVNRPILLSDEHGCVLRPKMVSKFLKLRSNDGRSTVMSYAFFHAFKFPDSLQVFIRCKVEICRFGCPEHCDKAAAPSNAGDQVASYTSEIKASFAPAVAKPPAPAQIPAQFAPQPLPTPQYPQRRVQSAPVSLPDPPSTKRPFFSIGRKPSPASVSESKTSRPSVSSLFQRKKDTVVPAPVAAAQVSKPLIVEAQVVAIPIPIPGSQTQHQVSVPVATPIVHAAQPRHDSDSEEDRPVAEAKYSERSSGRFPYGPRSLKLDDLK